MSLNIAFWGKTVFLSLDGELPREGREGNFKTLHKFYYFLSNVLITYVSSIVSYLIVPYF